jgi:hypothetical protein
MGPVVTGYGRAQRIQLALVPRFAATYDVSALRTQGSQALGSSAPGRQGVGARSSVTVVQADLWLNPSDAVPGCCEGLDQ